MKQTTSFILFFILLFTTLTTVFAHAGTFYYVNRSHPQASDSNPGTEDWPWLTIQHAADIVNPGDVVYVKPGTYDERVQVKRSGATAAPIQFSAIAPAITRGFAITADHIHVSGFEITGTNSGHWRDGAGIFVVGNYCEIKKNFIYDVTRVGILLHADEPDSAVTSHCLVQENRIERAGLAGISVKGQNHVVEDNEISHSIQYPPSWSDPPDWVDADGIRFFGSGHLIRRNYIHDILQSDPGNVDPHIDCFQTWGPAHHIMFEQNICDNPNDRMQGFMISEVQMPVSDLTIRNNVIIAFRLLNIYDAENMTIVNNSFKGNLLYQGESGYGIELHNSPNAKVMNNIFYDVGRHRYPYLWHDAGSALGLQVGYNCIYMSDGQPPAGSPWPNDLWQVNPRIADANTSDFHLLADSPAIDAGFPLTEVTVDLEDKPRPQGIGHDIGAYEYSKEPDTDPAGRPVVWLRMDDETSDGLAEDSSNHGNHGTCNPGVTCPMLLSCGGHDGLGGYSFEGSKSYLDLGPSRFGIDQTNGFTLSFWIRPKKDNSTSYYKTIIRRGQYANPFAIDIDQDGRIWSSVRTDKNYRLGSNRKLIDDNWYHVAVTYKDGTRILYINGVEDISDRVSGSLQWGYSSSIPNTLVGKTPGGQSYFNGIIDDVKIYNIALETAEIYRLFIGEAPYSEEIELYHADFHVRLGQKIYAQIGETDPTNRLIATLAGDNGSYAILYQKQQNLEREEVFVLNQRYYGKGNYILKVRLLNQRGQALKGNDIAFKKPFDGFPKVGIDENNAICVDGKPFFPVYPWLVPKSNLNFWVGNGYANALRGIGYYRQYTLSDWKDYLNAVEKEGIKIIGPSRGEYWPHGLRRWQDASGVWHHDREVNMEKLAEYVNQTKDHPALLMWDWQDEPDLGGSGQFITPHEVRKWTEKCHELDPYHPVLVNFVGYNFTHGDSPWHHNREKMYSYLFNDRPSLNPGEDTGFSKKTFVADVYSMDYYPFEYATWKNWIGVEDMALAMDRMRQWNYDLVPVMACVETTDVAGDRDGDGMADGRKYPWTPAPTPEQVRMLAWVNVVHGAKGINWFHYFEPTPGKNFWEMARFTDQITRLTPAVLGPDYRGRVVYQELDAGRVDVMAKQYDNKIYLFAVNLKDKIERVKFTIEEAGVSSEADVFDEDRKLQLQDNLFIDTFQPYDVHIYIIEKGVQ